MSRATWTPHPSGGVSPPGRSVEPKQTRPVGRQTRPPRGVCPSVPTPALPQTRGVPPSALGLRPHPRDTHTDSDSSAQSRPASALRRLSPGSLVDPALHPSLSLELSGPVNSLPSSHSPGKSRLPWSLSSPPSTRAPPLTGSTQRLRAQGLGRSRLLSQVFLVLGLHSPSSDGEWYQLSGVSRGATDTYVAVCERTGLQRTYVNKSTGGPTPRMTHVMGVWGLPRAPRRPC